MTKVLDQHGKPMRPRAQYMRPDRSGILSMRRAITRDVKTDVHQGAARAFALAFDFMHNSGWLAGAADQIVTDMIGTELVLNARPDPSVFGGDMAARREWCRAVETAWWRWAQDPRECDLEGKATIAETLDGAVRYYLASGEAIGIISYLRASDQRRYGIETGTKVRLVSPHRLSRHTSLFEGWDQGINHDPNGRAVAYRFCQTDGGMDRDVDIMAISGTLRQVVHVMDRGVTPNSPRGISPMTPCFKTVAQSDQLADATLTTALLQTAFAATIHSPEASVDAFAAIETIQELTEYEGAADLAEDLFEVWHQRIEALKSRPLSIGGDATQVNHLGPGEKLELHGSQTPGPQYLPFQQNLMREVARCLGVTFENLTMDHSAASYSSTRMAVSSVWPTIERRRARIAAPFAQGIYDAWLDEQVGTDALPFPGGVTAFRAQRRAACAAEWRGPSKPTADPWKDAAAAKVRLEMGMTTLQEVYAERGLDWEEQTEQIAVEKGYLTGLDLPIPFGRTQGGAGGPQGGALDPVQENARA